ncbi:MAG: ABC transporter permease [Lachnospiraceae bacterium]|nr:ABC transporter permease [Lachnospiraceae bacterium]
MSVTLSKLSLRNAHRQTKDYLVYIITIIIAASLIYAFNGLVFSEEILTLSGILKSLPFVMVLASIVVVCIIGWLVSYTMRFMLTKRSRELGTYILLGIETRQVAQMFFVENLMIGAIAILFGTVCGNLFYQVLRAITLALFGVPYTFEFTFSLKAILLTILYFTLIFLLALYHSRKRISRMRIHDLIYFDRQNESAVIHKSKNRRKMYVGSILLGIVGTALLTTRHLTLAILGAIFIIVFLYGFFISFSSGVPAYYNKHPSKKYIGVTLIVFRSLTAKLATMGVVMVTVALLFTSTLLLENLGIFCHAIFQERIAETTVFDLFIGSVSNKEDHFEEYFAYRDDQISIAQDYQYKIYEADGSQVRDAIRLKIEYYEIYEYDTLMAYSDYTALRKILGYPTVDLLDGEYIIHCMPYLEPILNQYTEAITIHDKTLTPNPQLHTERFSQYLWDGNGYGYILIVPDEVAKAQPISHQIYCAMTITPIDETLVDGFIAIRDTKDKTIDGVDTIYAKSVVRSNTASMYAIIVYPLFYLALVLTMVAASILTIQLLSESNRCKQQYTLLRNLGMEQREIERSFSRQCALFFLMPTIPPILIAVPFMLTISTTTDPGVIQGAAHIWSMIGVAFGLFFAIYLVYILAAYRSFRKNTIHSFANLR